MTIRDQYPRHKARNRLCKLTQNSQVNQKNLLKFYQKIVWCPFRTVGISIIQKNKTTIHNDSSAFFHILYPAKFFSRQSRISA